MTPLQKWQKEEKFKEFEILLKHPLMQEALALVEELAKPDSGAALKVAMASSAPDAAHRVSAIHHTKSGIQTAIDELRKLGRVPFTREAPAHAEPFAHINEKYLERPNP